MIPIAGLATSTALTLVDATRDRQLEILRSRPEHARAITAFRERIADVQTAEQLIEDRELYVFVMKAFDLEDQIFGKALIQKVLESDVDERTALVNRLTDPRFREMYDTLGFGENGVGNTNTLDARWQEDMVDRYLESQFISDVYDQNESVGAVLEFRQKVADIERPLDILKDRDTAAFIRRALGFPDIIGTANIDRQAELIASRLDLETLSDPNVVDKLVRKYAALSNVFDTQQVTQNAAVQLVQSAVASGRAVQPIALDISAVSRLSSQASAL
ncbi:MAG: DUF1217 domain-containing protein [Pseudomonadota bacterium]